MKSFSMGPRFRIPRRGLLLLLLSAVLMPLFFQNCGIANFSTSSEENQEYLSAQAALAEQELLNGRVDLKIVEGSVTAVAVSKAQIYVAGSFLFYDGVKMPGLMKIDASGKVDSGFQQRIGTGIDRGIGSLTITSDGGLLLADVWTSNSVVFNGSPAKQIVKLNSDGSVQTDWKLPNVVAVYGGEAIRNVFSVPGMFGVLTAESLQFFDLRGYLIWGKGFISPTPLPAQATPSADGKRVLVSGIVGMEFGFGKSNAQLLNLEATNFGDLDPVFAANAGTGSKANTYGILADPAGQFFIVSAVKSGASSDYSWNNSPVEIQKDIYKVRMNGSLDVSWSPALGVQGGSPSNLAAIDSQGRVYVMTKGNVRSADGVAVQAGGLVRLTKEGRLDTEFGPFTGVVSGAKVVTDDKIVVWGSLTKYRDTPCGPLLFLHANGDIYQGVSPIAAPTPKSMKASQ